MQQGRVPNTSVDRGGLLFASTFNIGSSITLDNKLSYNKVASPNYPAYGYGPNNHIYTLLIWQGTDVDPQAQRNNFWVPGQEGFKQANWNYAWYNNPYFGAHERNQEYDSDVYRGQLKLRWDIAQNMYVQARSSVNKKDQFEDQERPKSYLRYGDPRDGFYKTWNMADLSIDNDLQLRYENQFTSFFNFNVLAGANSSFRRFEEYYNSTDGLVVPDVYSLSNTMRSVQGSTEQRKKAIRSLYGSVDFEFLDAFFLNLSGRNDWSSVMPESNNSYFYPSASLSTVVSNLVEMPELISNLRLYGSWAKVSSDLDPNFVNPYQTIAYYNKTGTFNGNPQLTYPSGIVNPNINPQQSVTKEAGLAAGFLDNRLNLNVTYYNIVDLNQIIDLPISLASGFSSRKINGNEYTTNGVEVTVNSTPVRNSNFNWDLTANWSRRVQKLTSIYGDQNEFNNLSVGERADSYYATGWMKSPDGQVILNEETGLPTQDPNPQLKGHLSPDWRFGLQNQFRYKKLALNVSVDGAVGGLMNSLTVEKMWWGGKHPESTRWRDEEYAAGEPVYVPEGVNVVSGELNTDTDGTIISDTRDFQENTTAVGWQQWAQNYPYRARVTQAESELFANVFDRSFVKLRDVSLSYDMTSLVSNLGISKLRLTAFGYNLAILKKAKIIDPDFGNDNNLQDPSSRYVGLKIDLSL
jgi:outer membrane receptor protein involved in Fe transport